MASEILVKINVESGKAEVSLGKAKKGVDKLASSTKKLSDLQKQEAVDVEVLNEQIRIQTDINKAAAKSQLGLAQSTKKTSKAFKQSKTQVGLNNAILTEAGRAASDLRFGFNGVANNVGQMASLFGSLITTSDNVGTSLKELGKSLLGTGGILIAVQLLIAYGDRVISFFTGSEKAVSRFQKGIDDATASLDTQIETFDRLIGTLETYGDIGKFTEDADFLLAGSFSKYKTAMKDLEEGAKIEFTDIFGEKNILEGTKAIDKYRELFLKFLKAKREEAVVTAQLDATTKDGDLQFAKGSETRNKFILKRTELLRKRLVLQRELELIKPDDDEGSAASLKIFEGKLLQLEKLEEKYRRESIDKDLLTEDEKISNQKEAALISLQITVKAFKDKEKARLDAFIASTKANEEAGKITKEQSEKLQKDANAEFKKSMVKANEEAGDVRIQIEAKIQTKLLQLERDRREQSRKEQENSFELDRQSKLNRGETQIKDLALLEEAKSQTILEQLLGTNRTEIRVTRDTLELKKSYAEDEIKRINDLLSNSEISQERRSQLENDLTVQQGIQTDTRIQILGLEKKAKEELVNSVALGLGAVSSLLKKGTDAQKAVSIASTLISTYTSAQKAYESQLTATPDSPIRAVIAATSAVVQGLARVQAIRNVNPAGKNGSASSAPSVSAPSFNVVGASATNQLAQTVAGQINEPLRAYVVGSDISDQQELDRSIISTAGIG